MIAMKHRNSLMLLRIAQGDALGMATEYLDLELPEHQHVKFEALKLEHYVKHPKWDIPAGHYTDDTQMSIAVTRTLLHHDFALPFSGTTETSGHLERGAFFGEWDKIVEMRRAFAGSFVGYFKRDPRLGYSKYFQKFLENVVSADDFLVSCNPDSDKNGAAMRSVPLGALPDPKLVLHVAREQARITHDTDGGRQASEMVALMSHFALYEDEPMSDLYKFLAGPMLPWSARQFLPWGGSPVTGSDVGMKTALAVMTLISEEKTLLDIARRAIEWGGDTDTVIAIAWGIASARMHEELPAWLDEGLENGAYGRDYLTDLGDELMDKYDGNSR
jgi:ADP-ribosyl-[dinitrogen reductase] hydrolase